MKPKLCNELSLYATALQAMPAHGTNFQAMVMAMYYWFVDLPYMVKSPKS